MTATTENAPSLSGNSAEGETETLLKGTILNDATSVPQTIAVDARFAGGSIIVESDDEYTGDGRHGVRVDFPGESVWLFAHEARALAAALTAAAATQPKRLRRSPQVDDHLRGLDD